MAQVVPGVVRVEMRYANNSQPVMENVYHVGYGGSVGVADLASLGSLFSGWEDAHAKALRTGDIFLYEIVLTDLKDLTGARITQAVSPVISGTNIGTPSPDNVTWAAKADIGKRGRGTAGRVFWIGMPNDVIAANQVSTVYAGLILAALDTLKADVAASAPFTGLVIPHFVKAGVRPPVVSADEVVAFLGSDLFVDSQRDRLPFHKKHKKPRTRP